MLASRTPRGLAPSAVLAGLLLLSFPLTGAPRLVKDFDTVLAHDRGRVVEPGVALGDDLYFTASDPDHGIELWRSDGSAGGTYRLTDVCAGPCDGQPFEITPAVGHVFFTADDGFSGRELWASDGTPGSERRLGDLCPGPCSSVLGSLTAAGGRLFFSRQTPDALELWTSDGTPAGTARLSTLCTGAAPACNTGLDLPMTTFGGHVFVRVFQNTTLTVWTSDGTAAGRCRSQTSWDPACRLPPPCRSTPAASSSSSPPTASGGPT